MKLRVVSEFPFDPATTWEIFESEAFGERLEAATDLKREVIERREEGGILIRRLRMQSHRDLPAMVGRALGMKRLTYEQENRFDPAKSRLTWKVFLPVMKDRISVSGTTIVTPTEEGSLRVVDGDISVRIKLIGGQIEKAVVAEFERSMGRAVDVARSVYEDEYEGR